MCIFEDKDNKHIYLSTEINHVDICIVQGKHHSIAVVKLIDFLWLTQVFL